MKHKEALEAAEKMVERLHKKIGGDWKAMTFFEDKDLDPGKWKYFAMLGTMSVYPHGEGKYYCYLNTDDAPGRAPSYFHHTYSMAKTPEDAVIQRLKYARDFVSTTKRIIDDNVDLLSQKVIDYYQQVYRLENAMGYTVGFVQIKKIEYMDTTAESIHNWITEAWYDFYTSEEIFDRNEIVAFCAYFNNKYTSFAIAPVKITRITPS